MGDAYSLFAHALMNNEQHPTHLLNGWRFQVLLIIVLLSAVGYLLFALWGGWPQTVAAAYKVGLWGMLVALGCSLVNYGLRFIRWQGFLQALSCTISPIESLKIYISGFALTTTPAKSGEMVRSLFLKEYGLGYHQGAGLFFAERVSDLIGILLLATIGLWEHPDARPLCIGMMAALLVALGLLRKKRLLFLLKRVVVKYLSQRIARFVFFIIKMLESLRTCLPTRMLLYSTVLSVLAWGIEGLAFYYVLQLLGADVPLLSAVFIYAFALLIGGISFLPGGLGGAEVTMLQLLLWHHVDSADAVVATVLIRLATLWFAVVLGLGTLPFLMWRSNK